MKTTKSPILLDIFSKRKQSISKENKKEEIKEPIVIDYREKNSLVYSYLVKQSFPVEFKELKIGDYIVKDTVIERKTVNDFISSMLNHRLMNQIEELKQYENKLLIIEGISEQELYKEDREGVSANAIRGFLLSILLKHKMPIIYSNDAEDTARFIGVLSKRKDTEINLNAKKKTLNKKEQLQFIIESFPGVGPKKAKRLLEKFGSIQNIILAPTEDLKEILGVNANIVREIIERKY
jgi:ERCC4-type nuclease